jgi:hypothetical protein
MPYKPKNRKYQALVTALKGQNTSAMGIAHRINTLTMGIAIDLS